MTLEILSMVVYEFQQAVHQLIEGHTRTETRDDGEQPGVPPGEYLQWPDLSVPLRPEGVTSYGLPHFRAIFRVQRAQRDNAK